MKAESNLQPKNKFEIENIIDRKCDIVFYNNVEEIVALDDKEKRYSYDIYRLKANYRDDLEKDLNDNQEKFEKWLELAKNTEYNKLAAEVRSKRNELLKESDQYMCLDRMNIDASDEDITIVTVTKIAVAFFKSIFKILNGNYAKYRQELRDITKQEGFPYNVEFPKEPNTNDESEE